MKSLQLPFGSLPIRIGMFSFVFQVLPSRPPGFVLSQKQDNIRASGDTQERQEGSSSCARTGGQLSQKEPHMED